MGDLLVGATSTDQAPH